MKLAVRGLPTLEARNLRFGQPDANGQVALQHTAQGAANPCRHCLQLIPEGEQMLIAAYRPFPRSQPYAEVGPIFLHARDCERYESDVLPQWFTYLSPAVIRGYDCNDWILYETGAVVCGDALADECQKILMNADVAYVHIRSKFNCFQCRIDRE